MGMEAGSSGVEISTQVESVSMISDFREGLLESEVIWSSFRSLTTLSPLTAIERIDRCSVLVALCSVAFMGGA